MPGLALLDDDDTEEAELDCAELVLLDELEATELLLDAAEDDEELLAELDATELDDALDETLEAELELPPTDELL